MEFQSPENSLQLEDGLSIEHRRVFEAYLRLLERWNQIHALTSLPPDQRWEELILDSMAVLPCLAHFEAGARVADLGSGMGIPAVVIAAMRPDLRVLAVDASSKKMAFVRQAALELGLRNLEIHCGRIENLQPLEAQVGVSKALGSLELVSGFWSRHGCSGAPLFLFKGASTEQEPAPLGWQARSHPYELPKRGKRVIIELVAWSGSA